MASKDINVENEVMKFLGINETSPEFEQFNKSLGKKGKITLPDGSTQSISGYEMLYLSLSQIDEFSSKSPAQSSEYAKLKKQLRDMLKSNPEELSVNSPKFLGILLAANLSSNLIFNGQQVDLSGVLNGISFEDMIIKLYEQAPEPLKDLLAKELEITRNLNSDGTVKYNIGNTHALNHFIFSSSINYLFMSTLAQYKESEQSIDDFMDEFKTLYLSKVFFDAAVFNLYSSRKISPGEANKLTSVAASFIVKSLALQRDGREVAASLMNLAELVYSGKDISEIIRTWRDSNAAKYSELYSKNENVDFGDATSDERKLLSVMFLPKELRQNSKAALTAVRNTNQILKKLIPKLSKFDNPLYSMYLGETDVYGVIAQHAETLFSSKGYSREESIEMFKTFFFSFVRNHYKEGKSIDQLVNDYQHDLKRLLDNLSERKEVVRSIKKNFNEVYPGEKFPPSMLVPENVVGYALLMANERTLFTEYSGQVEKLRKGRKVALEVSVEAKSQADVVYKKTKGKKAKEFVFEIKENTLKYLTPFNSNEFDEVTIYITKSGKEQKVVLDSTERAGQKISLPIAFFVSHLVNDVYSRGVTFHYLSSKKSVEELSTSFSLYYSAPRTSTGKKQIRFMSKNIERMEAFSSYEAFISSDFSRTNLGMKAMKYADAFIDTITKVEKNKTFTQEQLEKLWLSAAKSFVITNLYEFNMDDVFLGRGLYSSAQFTYSDLMEISKNLDNFIDNGTTLNITKKFLLNLDGNGFRVGSGVNFLGFKGGTSLWILREDGTRELIAYSTAKGLVIKKPKVLLKNSDNVILRYHRGKKDLSKLAQDESKLWKDGRIYGHSTGLRFYVTKALLTEKTLIEYGYNTSSTIVKKVTAKDYTPSEVPLAPRRFNAVLPAFLPVSEDLTYTKPGEIIYHEKQEIETEVIPTNEQTVMSNEDFERLLEGLGVPKDKIDEITNRYSSFNDRMKSVAEYLSQVNFPQVHEIIRSNNLLDSLQIGESTTIKLDGTPLQYKFTRIGEDVFSFKVIDSRGKIYLTGKVDYKNTLVMTSKGLSSEIWRRRFFADLKLWDGTVVGGRLGMGAFFTGYTSSYPLEPSKKGRFGMTAAPYLYYSKAIAQGTNWNVFTTGTLVLTPQIGMLYSKGLKRYIDSKNYSLTSSLGLGLNRQFYLRIGALMNLGFSGGLVAASSIGNWNQSPVPNAPLSQHGYYLRASTSFKYKRMNFTVNSTRITSPGTKPRTTHSAFVSYTDEKGNSTLGVGVYNADNSKTFIPAITMNVPKVFKGMGKVAKYIFWDLPKKLFTEEERREEIQKQQAKENVEVSKEKIQLD